MGQGSEPGWEEGTPFLLGACPCASETYEPWLPVCLSAPLFCDFPCSPHQGVSTVLQGCKSEPAAPASPRAPGGPPRCGWGLSWAFPGLLSTLGPPKVRLPQVPLEDALAIRPPAPLPPLGAPLLLRESPAGSHFLCPSSGPFSASPLRGGWTRFPSFSLLKGPLRPARPVVGPAGPATRRHCPAGPLVSCPLFLPWVRRLVHRARSSSWRRSGSRRRCRCRWNRCRWRQMPRRKVQPPPEDNDC